MNLQLNVQTNSIVKDYRFWFPVYPDLKKPIGGVKQIHRVAQALVSIGFECYLVQDSEDFHPGWFDSNLKVVSKENWFSIVSLDPSRDHIVLAETFIPLINTLFPLIPKIIFNQNASYTFGLPAKDMFNPKWVSKIYKLPSVSQVWCVSSFDRNFLVNGFQLPPNRVRLLANSIEDISSQLGQAIPKLNQISYMTRKNSLGSAIVSNMLSSQNRLDGWVLKPISNMNHMNVISTLLKSRIFLSFGHPEGFGLPVAEALACRCAVVGYSGLGGRELFRLAKGFDLSYSVEYGDWFGFIKGVHWFAQRLSTMRADFDYQSSLLSKEVLSKYSDENLKQSLYDALEELANI